MATAARNIHIAVLDVDIPARALYEKHGLCSAQFRKILEETAIHLNNTVLANETPIAISITAYDIRGGHYPSLTKLRGHPSQDQWPDVSPVDAILITGGAPGVYELDASPWMQTLQTFLRTVYADFPQIRIMGTCFGHQLIGQSLVTYNSDAASSTSDVWVEKCALGREIGVYNIKLDPAFVSAFPQALGHLPANQMRIQMFHGDRVLAVPKGTVTHSTESPAAALPAPWINVGTTDICPIQGLYHPGRVLSIQGHYELDAFGMQETCLDFAPRMGWQGSKLALFLEQISAGKEDVKGERQDDARAFASAVCCFLAGIEVKA